MKTTTQAPPLTISLADLEQTKHVTKARALIGNWPLASGIGAFLDQSSGDEEDDMLGRLYDRVFDDAIGLLATWGGNQEHARRLRALNAALDEGGGESILEQYTRCLLALGVCYGVRLAGER